MRIRGPVSHAAVLDTFRLARPDAGGSTPWTLRLLEQADAELGPDWWDVELTGAEALAVVLPFHAGEPCHGDRLTLVGPEGLSVAAAAGRFRTIEADYARENRSCWGRIDRARRDPLSRVVLAVAPIDHEEYRGLMEKPSARTPADTPHFYCLDGRHRLIGWALAGALSAGAIVPAHVAGALAPADG